MSQDTNTEQKQKPEVEQELSKVATNPKQSILILVVISMAFLYLFFNLFISGDSNEKKPADLAVPDNVTKPVQIDPDDNIPDIPTLPSVPKLEDLAPPAPPPNVDPFPTATDTTLPELPSIANNTTNTASPLPFSRKQDSGDGKKRHDAKRKSSIVLVAGTVPTKSVDQLEEEVNFKHRGDMNLLLGRGKLLDAIIETAVNTDLGGEIRAIISRDIYSEWGKNILLPKGSRIFGNYATGIDGAYGRIAIEWTRIDLINGYTLNISGLGVDGLGRKGNQGRVDNKFKERLSNAILRSALNVAVARGLDSLVTPQISSKAAATNNQESSNIKNIANGIFTQAGLTAVTKRVQICASVSSAITDKTSTAYTKINTACETLRADSSSATDDAKLVSLMATINSSTDELIKNTNSSVEETKAQQATKQGYSDITDIVKSFVEEQEFQPTITIDQGTPVKIYVNKDYKFPKRVLNKSQGMR